MVSTTVFTIHGINTKGEWQEMLHPFFAPHFNKCIAVKYDGYTAGPVLGKFGKLGRIAGDLKGRFKLAFEKGFTEARDKIKKELEFHGADTVASYVVAHSYGTVLTASVMQFPENLQMIDRVYFVGSALRRDFDWNKNPLHEKHFLLTSEFGGKDEALPHAANVNNWSKKKWIGGWFSSLVGDAGRVGFQGPSSLVHNVLDPLSGCQQCDAKPYSQKVKVHNVELPEFLHSDAFISPLHAKALVLPILWGFAPKRYNDFQRLCREARDYANENPNSKDNPKAAELLDLQIEYVDDFDMSNENGTLKTVREQIRRVLDSQLHQYGIDLSEEVRQNSIPLIARGVWQKVCEAYDNQDDFEKAKGLLPRKAMQFALKPLLKDWGAVDGGTIAAK